MLSVFISHCQEDIEFAQKLYDFLNSASIQPWLDKRNLLPGQRWDFEINKALRKADYIIILLSKIAVKKRGYVQREFKLALDYCKEKLDDDIYIIPVKIDDCDIPTSLSEFHWIEYNQENSFEQILLALKTQQQKINDAGGNLEKIKSPNVYDETKVDNNKSTIRNSIEEKQSGQTTKNSNSKFTGGSKVAIIVIIIVLIGTIISTVMSLNESDANLNRTNAKQTMKDDKEQNQTSFQLGVDSPKNQIVPSPTTVNVNQIKNPVVPSQTTVKADKANNNKTDVNKEAPIQIKSQSETNSNIGSPETNVIVPKPPVTLPSNIDPFESDFCGEIIMLIASSKNGFTDIRQGLKEHFVSEHEGGMGNWNSSHTAGRLYPPKGSYSDVYGTNINTKKRCEITIESDAKLRSNKFEVDLYDGSDEKECKRLLSEYVSKIGCLEIKRRWKNGDDEYIVLGGDMDGIILAFERRLGNNGRVIFSFNFGTSTAL